VVQDDCDYIPLRDKRLDDVNKCAIPLVSANFVIPYPPGFPILVPGQEVSQAIIDFFRHLVRLLLLLLVSPKQSSSFELLCIRRT
jgi:hypothetical protein